MSTFASGKMACRSPRASRSWPFFFSIASEKVQFQEHFPNYYSQRKSMLQQAAGSRRRLHDDSRGRRPSVSSNCNVVPGLVQIGSAARSVDPSPAGEWRKLRQTFQVHEARAVPAAGTPPHELRRFPVAISFKANVAERVLWSFLDLRLFRARSTAISTRIKGRSKGSEARRACGVPSSASGTPWSNKSTPYTWYSARPWRGLRRPRIPRSGVCSSPRRAAKSRWRRGNSDFSGTSLRGSGAPTTASPASERENATGSCCGGMADDPGYCVDGVQIAVAKPRGGGGNFAGRRNQGGCEPRAA